MSMGTRAQLGVFGARPLANPIVGGSAGELTGTERERIQGIGSVIQALLAAGSTPTMPAGVWTDIATVSITLTAGTWLVWGWSELQNVGGFAANVGLRIDQIPLLQNSHYLVNTESRTIIVPASVLVVPATQLVKLQAYGGAGTTTTARGSNIALTGTQATGIRAMRVA